jgi:hypothetical protein
MHADIAGHEIERLDPLEFQPVDRQLAAMSDARSAQAGFRKSADRATTRIEKDVRTQSNYPEAGRGRVAQCSAKPASPIAPATA